MSCLLQQSKVRSQDANRCHGDFGSPGDLDVDEMMVSKCLEDIAQVRNQRCAFVNTAMNVGIP
jgi:hypothetical protein